MTGSGDLIPRHNESHAAPVSPRNAPAIVRRRRQRRRSSPGRNSSRARSPTPTPARTTSTPSASSSPGPKAAAWSCLASPPATSASISRTWNWPCRPRSSTWRPCEDSSTGWSTATSSSSTRPPPSGPSAIPSSKARRRRSAPNRPGRCSSRSTPRTTVGLRDRAVLAVLIYTAARVGAVAKLAVKSLGTTAPQYTLRFSEKGGKSREIPVRHDLEQFLLDYVQAAGITEGPLFRTANRQDEDADHERHDRYRHLPDDEAAAQGGRASRASSRRTRSGWRP